MNEFDHGRQIIVCLALIAPGIGHQQHQHRANPLATGIDDIFGNLVNQRHIGVKLAADDGIHYLHIGGNGIGNGVFRCVMIGGCQDKTCKMAIRVAELYDVIPCDACTRAAAWQNIQQPGPLFCQSFC